MAAKEHMLLLLPVLLCFAVLQVGHGSTDPEDASALLSLMSQWTNTPPSWDKSDDPCGMNWDGVVCGNSRVTVVRLSSMGIKGALSGDIGQLTELRSLDLSFNNELGGPLSPSIGNLKKLTTLILAGCDFSGNIPSELGNLPQLSFLALNSNKFSGKIPASLGGLSNLYWLDLADNQLSGALPVSTNKALGLDQLLHTKHLYASSFPFGRGILAHWRTICRPLPPVTAMLAHSTSLRQPPPLLPHLGTGAALAVVSHPFHPAEGLVGQ